MSNQNKQLVADFIDKIWNNRQYDELCQLLHNNFEDHSLPPSLPPGSAGLRLWIDSLGKAFDHTTRIDEILSEGQKVAVRVTMLLKHTGNWRGIDATQKEFGTGGFRMFRISNSKIIEHWGLLDATTIENAIRH